MPKSIQPKARQHIHDIRMAEKREDAERAIDKFLETYNLKYPKATECLEKDREQLLAFYEFPTEHWVHLRTSNPIESTFATVRLRTKKTRGYMSRTTILPLVYRLGLSAENVWRNL